MFRMFTALYYKMDIASACVSLMNNWRLALCSEEKRNISQRREAVTHSLRCHSVKALHGEDVCLLSSTSWRSGCKGTSNDIPQDPSTFSQQRSAFPLSSSLSSWLKQCTRSDSSNTSANFVVQPRLLRRFAGGLWWTHALVTDSSVRSDDRPDVRLIHQYHHQDGVLLVHVVGWFRIVLFDDLDTLRQTFTLPNADYL